MVQLKLNNKILQNALKVGSVVIVSHLLHREVKEGEVVPDGDDRLGSLATHRRPEAAVQLDHHELVQHGLCPRLIRGSQIVVGPDLKRED